MICFSLIDFWLTVLNNYSIFLISLEETVYESRAIYPGSEYPF